MENRPFTLAQGLTVQYANLCFWKSALKRKHFRKLKKYVEEQNAKLTESSTGFDVYRGLDLDSWVRTRIPYTIPNAKPKTIHG